MSPLNRRAFLGALAAIPAAAFWRSPSQTIVRFTAIDHISIDPGTFSPDRTIPIVFGDVPREWLKVPYYRGYDPWDYAASLARGHRPELKLITSLDQDPELQH